MLGFFMILTFTALSLIGCYAILCLIEKIILKLEEYKGR